MLYLAYLTAPFFRLTKREMSTMSLGFGDSFRTFLSTTRDVNVNRLEGDFLDYITELNSNEALRHSDPLAFSKLVASELSDFSDMSVQLGILRALNGLKTQSNQKSIDSVKGFMQGVTISRATVVTPRHDDIKEVLHIDLISPNNL